MWILLLTTLPTQPNAVRLRIWRALKGLGCVAVRDGAYLLPESEVEKFEALADEVRQHGGTASVLNLLPGMEWLSFPEEVLVFGEMMMSQVDLRIEANNLTTFEDKFRHRPTVSFPRALKQYTSPQVLIEEFEDAVSLESFLCVGLTVHSAARPDAGRPFAGPKVAVPSTTE